MKNKLKAVICHKEYTLMSEESQEYTERLAQKLDAQVYSLIKKSPSLSITDAALLTALDYLDELEKSGQNIDNIRSQIKEYVDDAARARNQANDVQRENLLLKERIRSLEKELNERTNFSLTQKNEEEVNAKEILSQDIKEAIEKPITPVKEELSSKKAGGFAGMVNYSPDNHGGNK